MIADTRFNSIPFNKKHDSTHLWCFNFAKFYFGNKLCNFAGLTAKIPYISECYTIDIEIQNEPATASFIMSSWEFPYALPWLKKWIVIVTLSRFLDSFLKIMDSDSLGIHVDWVKTQVRFIITAFHKAQLNSNSTLPAEPVDSSGFICELNPIQFVNPWIQLPITAASSAHTNNYLIKRIILLNKTGHLPGPQISLILSEYFCHAVFQPTWKCSVATLILDIIHWRLTNIIWITAWRCWYHVYVIHVHQTAGEFGQGG